MVTATLGDTRQDILTLLNAIPIVGPRIAAAVPTIETYIQGQAKTGAEQAIPDIRAEVAKTAHAAVRPYVLAAIGLGAIGALFGTAALVKLKWR